jgi:small subunit ribosomal protein S1
MTLNVPGPGEQEELASSTPAGLSETPAEAMPADTSTADVQPERDEPIDEMIDVPVAASDDEFDGEGASEIEPDEPEAVGEAAVQAPDIPGIKKGELIDGTIIATSPTSITVDVGAPSEGVIPGRELERMSREMLDALKPGAPIMVYVVNPHDVNGNVLLSVNRALEEMDWRKAEEFRASQQVYESHVSGYNKGGLIVRFGRLRGFVPQSQISNDRRQAIDGETPEERWGKMVNDTIAVKVMEVDRSRNRLILSERAASREVREQRKESLIGNLQVGDIRTGRVVSIVDFGVFVDIGGAEGLVHLTELSWQHVTHPRDLVKVGQEVKVEVISVDPKRKRIGLSMKRQEADPWDAVAINYEVGQLVQGTITKLTKFGAFAQIADNPEIEGLIHISELSDQRVNHPREVVQEGDQLTLRVVKMDIPNRRLGLSLKRVNSAEYLDRDWR